MNNDLRGKKLLILAGNDVHVKIVNAAKSIGVYTIVTDYLPVSASPAKLVADEYWMLSTSDVDAVVNKCREEHVDGVLNYCIDTVQQSYCDICFKLGVPCYGTRSQFEVLTNKRKFKEFCVKSGLDIVQEYTEKQIDSGMVTYPIIIKPSDSRGSRGISICHSSREVPLAIEVAKKESRDGQIIIERYIEGQHDIGLAFIVIDGTPYLTKISDRLLGKKEDGLQCQQMVSLLPSVYAEEIISIIHSSISVFVNNLGIKFGPVFMQGIWDGARIYMYDPGFRFPGSDYDVVESNETGFDCMLSLVRFALTGDVTSCIGNPVGAYNYNGGTCVIFAITCKSGKIASITGVQQLKEKYNIASIRQMYGEGDEVPLTGDVRQRVFEFTFFMRERGDFMHVAHDIYDTISIVDEYGHDMIISRVC